MKVFSLTFSSILAHAYKKSDLVWTNQPMHAADSKRHKESFVVERKKTKGHMALSFLQIYSSLSFSQPYNFKFNASEVSFSDTHTHTRI